VLLCLLHILAYNNNSSFSPLLNLVQNIKWIPYWIRSLALTQVLTVHLPKIHVDKTIYHIMIIHIDLFLKYQFSKETPSSNAVEFSLVKQPEIGERLYISLELLSWFHCHFVCTYVDMFHVIYMGYKYLV